MECINCGDDVTVTYVWTLEANSENATIDNDFDWDTYAIVDATDHSLSVDPFGFLHVIASEQYAFVLTGACFSVRYTNLQKQYWVEVHVYILVVKIGPIFCVDVL